MQLLDRGQGHSFDSSFEHGHPRLTHTELLLSKLRSVCFNARHVRNGALSDTVATAKDSPGQVARVPYK